MIQVSASREAFALVLVWCPDSSRSDPDTAQAKGEVEAMKSSSWEVEILEEDHGEGADIMAMVEADLAAEPEEAALVAEMGART
jgi:hypothetical protein